MLAAAEAETELEEGGGMTLTRSRLSWLLESQAWTQNSG